MFFCVIFFFFCLVRAFFHEEKRHKQCNFLQLCREVFPMERGNRKKRKINRKGEDCGLLFPQTLQEHALNVHYIITGRSIHLQRLLVYERGNRILFTFGQTTRTSGTRTYTIHHHQMCHNFLNTDENCKTCCRWIGKLINQIHLTLCQSDTFLEMKHSHY